MNLTEMVSICTRREIMDTTTTRQVKIFVGSCLEDEVNKWLSENRPNVMRMHVSSGTNMASGIIEINKLQIIVMIEYIPRDERSDPDNRF